MQFSIEEQSFSDTETGVRYTFGVNRQDTALVTITASYEDGHTRVWTYGRNAGLKSEESFPAGVKPTTVVPRDNPSPRDPRQLEDEINPPPKADGTPAEPVIPATTHKNEMPGGGPGVRTSGPAGRVNTTSSLSGKK